MTGSILSVESLSGVYGKREALRDVSFELGIGSIVGLLGANGAGKSTLIRRLLGFGSGGGRVSWMGESPRPPYAPRPSRVGIVWDSLRCPPGLTVSRMLLAVARSQGIPKSEVEVVLRQVDLLYAAETRVGHLSMGMKQRLSIAAAILPRPMVLIMDEPGNGLDPFGLDWLRAFCVSFARSDGIILLSSHQLANLESYIDRVFILDSGSLVFSGTADNLTVKTTSSIVGCECIDAVASEVVNLGGRLSGRRGEELVIVGLNHASVVEVVNRVGGRVNLLYEDRGSISDAFYKLSHADREG